jgi:hypothetical protein
VAAGKDIANKKTSEYIVVVDKSNRLPIVKKIK